MRWVNHVACLIVVTGVLQGEQTQAPADTALSLARERYYQAVDGDKGALPQAIRLWKDLRAAQPNNATVLAYSGSTQLLEASNTMAVWKKGNLSKDGLALLDEAVGRAPYD